MILVGPPGLLWGLSGTFLGLSGEWGVGASLGLRALGFAIIYNSSGLGKLGKLGAVVNCVRIVYNRK